jgi:hemoglobin/transferrin/lactoferrin receptor protein
VRLAALLALCSSGLQAETATPLPGITNTATRTERAVDDVPATVTVTPATSVEARGVRDLRDLFRHEVDLSVRAASPRFGAALGSTGRAGNEGLNVRGLEGNQVLLLVDGVRLPQAFAFGAFAVGRGDYLFLEASAAAEVLRGPASTSFGSDGLAGALSLRTLEPADVLKGARAHGGFLRLGGSTLDGSRSATGAVAWRDGGSRGVEGLLLASRRHGHEARTQGTDASPDSRRTAPNPLRYEQSGLLAKVAVSPAASHRLGLTLEAVRRDIASDVLSARTAPPTPPAALPGTAVLRLDADDRVERARGSLRWRFDDVDAALVQRAEAQLYLQESRNRQRSFEDRSTAADRVRDGLYRERVAGLSAQAQVLLDGPLPQRLSAGLDVSENRIRALRDGTVPPFGESFPSKPFPDARYRLAGAFVQSEIDAGSVTLIPAARADRFELAASPEGFVGRVVSLSDQALTPRLGAVWRLDEAVRPYAQWARGFRAPTPDQVNNGFTNPAGFYESIGNPDLDPERAESLEIGVRGRLARTLRWQIAAYDNRYRDFISQQVVRGSFVAGDPAVFQFVNLDSARIRGAEVRADWSADGGLQLRAALAAARGHSDRGGVRTPLASIEPARAALGLQWNRGAFEWRADVLHARAKDPARIPAATPAAFAPPSYTVVDLGLSWRPEARWAVHLNVDNALDATYWRWSDVRGLASTSPVRDAFTAAPRSFSLVLRHDL